MSDTTNIKTLYGDALREAADHAVRAIPPAWPLTATVAVNPFLGQRTESFASTAALLARIAGVRLALPRAHYAEKIESGAIADEDLEAALQATNHVSRLDLAALKSAVSQEPTAVHPLPTIADLCFRATGKDWPGLISERIGTFAAGFFDDGQALWSASRQGGLYSAWRAFATHDLTPEILGLGGFGQHVAGTPETAQAAIERATMSLGMGGHPGTYFHQLLLSTGGWAQFTRHLQFKAELDGGKDETARDLLAIRLVFEEALFQRYKAHIEDEWIRIRRMHAEPATADFDMIIDHVLLKAAEHAAQRHLADSLMAAPQSPHEEKRPVLQAAFCIDVRSEVFRRSLESQDPGIRTLGFAGFFGLGTGHKGFASDVMEPRLPVLLKPAVFSCSAVADDSHADAKARFGARAVRAIGRFKLAAVSSFAFVEAMGPLYAGKLLRDSLRLTRKQHHDAKPQWSSALSLDARAGMAEAVLRAMSLAEDFARVVLLCGHGANVVNNPYASALHCGACGGYAGDVNARLLADLLNDVAVREKLGERAITIPADTIFLAGLHDTTTDSVTLFEQDLARPVDSNVMREIRRWLEQAASLARSERSRRLPHATTATVAARSRDWSETRPELGLAGCRAFVAAPRSRTAGLPLDGQVFLHDYVWKKDPDFKVLELILTAPVVVASWISLQYFGSVVAPSLFGSGNKLLHNVVGGMGVVEGNGGNLRVGLPWQSVHDGAKLLHEPLRLTVGIEAPTEAITGVLEKHPDVRALFDNGWLSLFSIDDRGAISSRYAGDRNWQPAFSKIGHMNNNASSRGVPIPC
jgi:uncharacterized protein